MDTWMSELLALTLKAGVTTLQPINILTGLLMLILQTLLIWVLMVVLTVVM